MSNEIENEYSRILAIQDKAFHIVSNAYSHIYNDERLFSDNAARSILCDKMTDLIRTRQWLLTARHLEEI